MGVFMPGRSNALAIKKRNKLSEAGKIYLIAKADGLFCAIVVGGNLFL